VFESLERMRVKGKERREREDEGRGSMVAYLSYFDVLKIK